MVSSTLVVWAAAIAIVQVGFGEDIGRAVEQLEKRFEPQPAERSAPGASPQPRDRSEDDIDPWQLVSV
ncbi:MAG: hypothetical protein ABSC94_18830 [Polyangiaceae bacterium]|jgi:hypothetical protein